MFSLYTKAQFYLSSMKNLKHPHLLERWNDNALISEEAAVQKCS